MTSRVDLFAGVVPFVRTAEHRSFGRAAASLGITTAAVSKAVRRLEEDLGVKLLERSSRVVTLTREGAEFFDRCRPAVLGVQGARDAVEASRREPRGELAVTLPYILAPFVVPGLAPLAHQFPKLRFRLHVTDRIARLAEESYDVAIRMGELPPSTHVARLLRTTRWVTVGAPSYLARRAAPRTPDDLAGHDCLRFLAPSGRPRDWSYAGGERTVTGTLLVDHGAELVSAARAGLGLCQVLDFMVHDALREGTLVEVLAAHAVAGPRIHALSTASRGRSASARAFIQFLVDAFR
ncbi:MAG: LysR family transcriptional regulator [Myxococcales bacterium]|nr:LysR family transcriptional regulator [Myxococcales bacterium]